MRVDYDFHPDESTVRVFMTPESGVLRLDDEIAVTEAIYGGVVLRHYSFADRWFKINVTTDLTGQLVETGEPGNRFALNCDIATPMEREGDATYAVDLFVDVLVQADLRVFHVGDEDEFENALLGSLLSRSEAAEARQGIGTLIDLIRTNRLLPWLHEVCAFGPCDPPRAPPMQRASVPDRLLLRSRPTW